MLPGPEIAVVEALKRFPEVKRVWLFGSRAHGDNLPRSDIDLAVEHDPLDGWRWFDIHDAADASTLCKIDLLQLDDLPEEFRESIKAKGRILYER